MKKLNIILLLGLFFFAAAVFPSCKKEEITQVEYLVPLWKGSLASAPQNPEAGWAYYDTVKKQSFIFDGTSWQVMAQDGQNGQNGKDGKDGVDGQNGKDGKDGKDGVDGKDGQNGLGLVWKGELEAAPSDAETNWAYYNSTEKKSFIYDGTTWLVLAKDGAQGEKGADGQNGKDGTNGTNGTDGGTSAGFVWKGELDANPSEPQTNWAYYNKTDKKAYIYDGAKWSILAQDGKDGQNGTNGTNGENGTDGVGITWKGTLTAAPASPQKGWAYYNSTDKKSYIHDGSAWQLLAQDGANGADGVGISWKGESASAPEEPENGWAYYDTEKKASYIYDGENWQVIAKDGKDAEPAEKVYAFTVDANNKKVAFSSGNLQYNKTEQKFQFAATQLEYLGTNSANDVIDLFCWGTGNNPTNTNVMETSFTDWGSKINDGKNWFTLSKDEWDYLINHNTKAWKTVNSVNGLVILPDGCTLNIANSDWATLAAAGAVFLPCGTKTYGEYWSSSPYPVVAGLAYFLGFDSVGDVLVLDNGRDLGLSVRLVRSL